MTYNLREDDMFKKTIIYVLALLAVFIFPVESAEDESEQINIRLATENQLMPIYLAKIVDENSGFDSSYLRKI